MTKYSILFYLNQQLSFVQIKNYSSLDNKTLKPYSIQTKDAQKTLKIESSDVTLISELLPEPTLNLAGRLEEFWIQNWPNIKDAEQTLLWIGPKASFTDTRMIYVWLKSWENNNFANSQESTIKPPKESTMQDITQDITQTTNQTGKNFINVWNSPEFSFNLLSDVSSNSNCQLIKLMNLAINEYRPDLLYSSKPRIGNN